jgi:citrate synthase
MKHDETLTTSISTYDEHGSTVRGKDLVRELIGEVTFTNMIYFYILGKAPSPAQTKVLDAVLVTLVDHGVIGALSARMVYRASPDALQGAVAAGMLQVGSVFAGVMEQVGKLLDQVIGSSDPKKTAEEIITSYRTNKRPLPGFGHHDFRPDDPRTPKLFKVAKDAGLSGKYVGALILLGKTVDEIYGRHITINATAAMAALLGEIGVPPEIMRGFALISRAPGLVGQLLEEQRKPAANQIARLVHENVRYVGD